MTFDDFRERIRVAVVAGVVSSTDVVTILHNHGWHTTKDVSEEQREKILQILKLL